MKDIYDQLTNALEHPEEMDPFATVKGYLHSLEGQLLMLLAAMGPGRGEVVEIGSYLGRSTCFLALGLKARKGGKVHAVDHFCGSAEHQVGMDLEETALVQDGTLFKQFVSNLDYYGLKPQVAPIVSDSVQAGKAWDGKPIRLLFIDGDHSYDATKRDFEAWCDHLEDEGLIAFHDVGDSWPGVTRMFNELTSPQGDWKCLMAVGSVRVVQRKAA